VRQLIDNEWLYLFRLDDEAVALQHAGEVTAAVTRGLVRRVQLRGELAHAVVDARRGGNVRAKPRSLAIRSTMKPGW
jgi:hypothetical protein